MPGETKERIGGWTVETLHAHLSEMMGARFEGIRELLREMDARQTQRFEAQEKATEKVDQRTREEKASANEWREAMKDREQSFVARSEYTQMHKAMDDRVTELKEAMDRIAGKGIGLNAGWGYLVGGLGMLAAVAVAVFAAFALLKR